MPSIGQGAMHALNMSTWLNPTERAAQGDKANRGQKIGDEKTVSTVQRR